MKSSPLSFAAAAVLFGCLSFSAIVVASGAGWNPFAVSWNFTNSGAFGDSFGPLNTIMAAIAAVSAIAAYLSQREELARVKHDSEIEQTRSEKRDFEVTFFNLLELFRETVKEIDVPDQYGHNSVIGRDALKRILDDYIGGTLGDDAADAEKFRKIYFRFRDDLAHYFRLFYHILKFVDGAPVQDKMLYVRLLRATLSSAEIVLIALNCLYGGGKEKLRPLVERYAILHNISTGDAKTRRITASFSNAAFGDRSFEESNLNFAY